MFLSCFALAPVVSLAFAPELDFRALPDANTTAGYEFTVVIELAGKPAVDLPFGIGRGGGPETAAELLADSLDGTPWVVRRDGLRTTLLSCGKVPVIRVRVEGHGPKPAVNWVLRSPVKK